MAAELFRNCVYNASLVNVSAWNAETDAQRAQQLTSLVEVVATGISLLICFAFFLIYGLGRSRGSNNSDDHGCAKKVRAVYNWDRSTDHYLCIACLALLQGLAFLISAGTDPAFSAYAMRDTACRIQAIAFQFATSGLNLAVVAEIVDMFLVLVKSVPVPQIRKKYTPWLVAFIFVVALAFTGIPLIFEATMGVQIYSQNHEAGFCWLNTQCESIMFAMFFNSLELAVFIVTTGLSIAIVVRVCSIYKHLRSHAKLPFWLYIVRRLLFAALVFLEHLLDSIFLINDRINPGTSPEGLHEIIAFGIHCPALIYLLAFLLPDAFYVSCCLATAKKRHFHVPLAKQGSAGHVVVRADEATDEAALRYNDLSSSSDEEGCDGGMDSVHSRVESQIHLRDVARSSTPGGAVAVAAAVVTGSSTAPDDDDDDDGTTPLALTRQSDEII